MPRNCFCPAPAWEPRAGTQPEFLSLWRLRIRVARMEFTCLISEWAHRMTCGKTTLEIYIRLLLMTKETPSHPPLAFPGVGRTVVLCGFSQGLSMALYFHLQRLTCWCHVHVHTIYTYMGMWVHTVCPLPHLMVLSVTTIFCCLALI